MSRRYHCNNCNESFETLRTYAARGIIKRDQIPDFRPESLTDLFYKSRKKRK